MKHGFRVWKEISGLEKEAKRNAQLLLQELEDEKTGGSKAGKRNIRKNKVVDMSSSAIAAADAAAADADAIRGALVEAFDAAQSALVEASASADAQSVHKDDEGQKSGDEGGGRGPPQYNPRVKGKNKKKVRAVVARIENGAGGGGGDNIWAKNNNKQKRAEDAHKQGADVAGEVGCGASGGDQLCTNLEQMSLAGRDPRMVWGGVGGGRGAVTLESQFLAKFNLGASHGASPLPAAVGAPSPAVRGGVMRFRYESLELATNKFDTRLGGGGFGSVFQGVLASGTQVAVKRLEGDADIDQMQTEVQVLSTVQHPNIVQLLGSSADGAALCLVYALMEGGSLQDRLACGGVGDRVALTANERILVLSDVARGLAYLHSEVCVIHRDVKSANILLDKNGMGRIGDFGIARAAIDNHGVTATHVQTKHVVGTLVYMAPEYKNGQLSTKVDTYALGLVILESITGYAIHDPAPGYSNLLCMFEGELDSANKLLTHLDKRTSWVLHKAQRVAALHSIAERCLEHRRHRRPEMVHLIPELEKMHRETEALPVYDSRECVVCMGASSDVEGWMMLRTCGHVCVCRVCCVGLNECPLCRSGVSESFVVFL